MPEPAKLKKSESLEIRIPYPTKQAFMARCRDEGRSASEALRTLIDGHLTAASEVRPAPAKDPKRRGGLRLLAAAAIGAAVGVAAAPSLAAHPVTEVRDLIVKRAFERLDANHDGQISFDEFSHRYDGR